MFSPTAVRRIKWGSRLSLLAGLVCMVLLGYVLIILLLADEATEQLGSGNPAAFRERFLPGSITMVAITAFTVVGFVGGLVGLHIRQAPSPRYKWPGTPGIVAALFGFAGFFVGGLGILLLSLIELLRGPSTTTPTTGLLRSVGLLTLAGGVGLLIGSGLSGVAILRAKVLPRWLGWLILFIGVGWPLLCILSIIAIPSITTSNANAGALSPTLPPTTPTLALVLLVGALVPLPIALLAMGYVLESNRPHRSRHTPSFMGVEIGRLWRWTGFGQKSLWDWMQLSATASIPVVIAVGGLLFTSAQNERNTELEQRRAQDEAIQSYLGEMSDLLADEGFRAYLLEAQNARGSQQDAEAEFQHTVAQARTLTVLKRLDAEPEDTATVRTDEDTVLGLRDGAQRLGSAERKGRVLEFLYQADLITAGKAVIDLKGADLDDANLAGVDLSSADLRGANLAHADLPNADLTNANLSGALLSSANLGNACLTNANVSGTDFRQAYLIGADLSETKGLVTNDLVRTIGISTESGFVGIGITKLPDSVSPPNTWSMRLPEQERASGIKLPTVIPTVRPGHNRPGGGGCGL